MKTRIKETVYLRRVVFEPQFKSKSIKNHLLICLFIPVLGWAAILAWLYERGFKDFFWESIIPEMVEEEIENIDKLEPGTEERARVLIDTFLKFKENQKEEIKIEIENLKILKTVYRKYP